MYVERVSTRAPAACLEERCTKKVVNNVKAIAVQSANCHEWRRWKDCSGAAGRGTAAAASRPLSDAAPQARSRPCRERQDQARLRRCMAEASIIFLDVFRFFAEVKRKILGVEIQETARLPGAAGL